MSDDNLRDFWSRLKRIDRQHRRLAHGYVTSVNHDGLIIAVPRRHRRVRVPFAGVALIAVALLGFKGAVHAHIGSTTYEQRIQALAAGSTVEQVGAWVMQADPLTLWISSQVRPFVG